jgi:hypothetical protein
LVIGHWSLVIGHWSIGQLVIGLPAGAGGPLRAGPWALLAIEAIELFGTFRDFNPNNPELGEARRAGCFVLRGLYFVLGAWQERTDE